MYNIYGWSGKSTILGWGGESNILGWVGWGGESTILGWGGNRLYWGGWVGNSIMRQHTRRHTLTFSPAGVLNSRAKRRRAIISTLVYYSSCFDFLLYIYIYSFLLSKYFKIFIILILECHIFIV